MRKKIITGLDIGTSKICAAIAEITQAGKINIRGIGVSPCDSVSGGVVSNLDKLTDSIAAALGTAEEKAKFRAHNIIANIGGGAVKGGSFEGALRFSSMPRGVLSRDIRKVIGVAKDLSVSLGEDSLHLIPLGYTLDSQDGIENPLGLYGTRLRVKLYIITCMTNLLRNIHKAVNHTGYELKEVIYTGMATSRLLSDEEKTDGVILIDLGSHVTELALFSKGKIRFNLIVEAGGSDLTDEISSQFKIPKRIAEDLKLRYGTIHERDLHIDERIVVDVQDRQVTIDRSSMNYIMHSKIKKILHSLKKGLEGSGLENNLPGGVVMSGASLLMSGVIEMAEKEFSLPVRMVVASDVIAEDSIISHPAYAACIGLVKYGRDTYTKPRGRLSFKKESFIEKNFYRLKEILADYF